RSRVVAVGEDRALALHEAIEALRHADGHALDGAGERAGVARLDDEVDVVVLDGELGHTRVEPDARGEERALEDAKAPAAAELPHVLFHPKGDVQGEARVDAPGEVRYARIWLARPPQALLPPPRGQARAEVELPGRGLLPRWTHSEKYLP